MSDQTTLEVVLSSESTVGNPIIQTVTVLGTVPIGPRGIDGVGGGGVTDATFLTATAHAGLSDEVVVGTSPGGELGGSWASPTVDATHSGSSHASVQAAAEATAAAALAGHVAAGDPHPGYLTPAEGNAAYQPLDGDLTALAAAGNSAVLAATTASFLTADETKLDGIETGAEVNDTAAEILSKLLTVDGAGSGLDADLLDGQSSAAFETPAGAQSKADAKVSDTAYDATSWNAVTGVAPSKNAVRDQIEALASLYQPLHADLTDLASRWVAASASGPASLDFLEDTDNGSNKATVIAPASLTADRTLTLPDETGTLVSTGSLGVYTSYVPTVDQAGARSTSAAAGAYMQLGKFVHCYGQLTLSAAGSTNNPILVSLPVAAVTTDQQQIGTGGIQRVTGTTYYRGEAVGLNSSTTIRFFQSASTTNGNAFGESGGPAFALASGDIITWNVTYRAA